MPEPVFTGVLQVCVVVRDLDEALQAYWDGYGIGPWEIYEFNPQTVEDMSRDEKPSEHAMQLAVAMIGNLQWELIEPLDDRSIYADFLRDHGPGLQHVAMGVADYAGTIELMHAKGHKVIQGGHYNGVSYAYLSTDRDLGFVSEIYDSIPAGQKPDRVYPPDGRPDPTGSG